MTRTTYHLPPQGALLRAVDHSLREDDLDAITAQATKLQYVQPAFATEIRGRLGQKLAEILPGARSLGYSDTGAILERGWAERAGLGWIWLTNIRAGQNRKAGIAGPEGSVSKLAFAEV